MISKHHVVHHQTTASEIWISDRKAGNKTFYYTCIFCRYRTLLSERHAKHSQRTATQVLDSDSAKRDRKVVHTFKVAERAGTPVTQKPTRPAKEEIVCGQWEGAKHNHRLDSLS